MRVLVPFTHIEEQTRAALDATGHHWTAYNVSHSDEAYWTFLDSQWRVGRTFCVVEHDIVIHPTALDELANCEHDWCGFGYEYIAGTIQYGLGCVKFSAALIDRNPDAIIRAGVLSDDRHPPRHWCRLDAWLQGAILAQCGEEKHYHEPHVGHTNPRHSHGC